MQHVHTQGVLISVAPELYLGQYLVRKGSRHHKAGVTHGTAKVHKTSLSKKDEVLPILEGVPVHLGLDVGFQLAVVLQPLNLDLTVKVPNVTDNCIILHLDKVLGSEDVLAASSGDKDVALAHTVIHCSHLIALHRCLQSIDGVHLSDDDTAAKPTKGHSRALTHITIASNHSNLASQHHICSSLDSVNEGLSAPIQVVELRLGH